jgi:hypothetical protein
MAEAGITLELIRSSIVRRNSLGCSGSRLSSPPFEVVEDKKLEFPDAAALRDSFTARLDAVIAANAAMLQDSLAGRPGPALSAAQMPDVSAARESTLALLDERIAVIWDEWHGQPQRLTPRAALA